mgnify:CR=1 FL=1
MFAGFVRSVPSRARKAVYSVKMPNCVERRTISFTSSVVFAVAPSAPRSRIASLSTAQLQGLETADMSALSSSQVATLSSVQAPSLSTDQLAAIDAAELLGLAHDRGHVAPGARADFAIFDLNDTLTQIGSFTGLSGGGGFTLRGFSSSSQLRDGFYRIGRFGTSNVDRIEVIKGSNAAIYGRTSPGGMINMISKPPKPTAQRFTPKTRRWRNYQE